VSEVDVRTSSTGLVGQLWDRNLKIPTSAYEIFSKLNFEFRRRGVIVLGVNEFGSSAGVLGSK
jgi:hypothetical protein